ncbi:unnamed protein product [Arabis nemorensis]|uniref:Uncharacterized protein n=1 Tax=Arabis nemorensis TaxID=586526 RepID=A0A565BUX3_9BRAS|nr:unnamed protein product [Arabis nemorensis]
MGCNLNSFLKALISSATFSHKSDGVPGEMGANARDGPRPEDGVNGHQVSILLSTFLV